MRRIIIAAYTSSCVCKILYSIFVNKMTNLLSDISFVSYLDESLEFDRCLLKQKIGSYQIILYKNQNSDHHSRNRET